MHPPPFQRVSFGSILVLALAAGASAAAQVGAPIQASPCTSHPSALDLRHAHASADWNGAPAAVRDATRAELDRLLFDEPGDGALWARGTTYKASFGPQGATVVPFFGSDAPQNYPLHMKVGAARIGSTSLDVTPAEHAMRIGDTVRIERAAFAEEYVLTKDTLEQRFVFDELPATGELALRIDIASELAGSDLGAALRFENELGRIDFGAAFAIDADGARVALDSTFVDGAIELRVPATFVAQAALPLVIDPLITTFTVAAYSIDDIYPDVAYDLSTDLWCVAWTTVFSANDLDCFAKFVTGGGVLQSTLVTIDFTTEWWATPKIANNNRTDVFLVVAAVAPLSGSSEIRGRIVSPVTLSAGPVFPISPPDGAYRNWPDVGGDPYPTASSYFCVVWQRYVSPTNMDIEMQMVSPSGALSGGMVPLDDSPQWHELPSIASSLGKDQPGSIAAWTVVWLSPDPQVAAHNTYGAQIGWNGAIVYSKFPFDLPIFDELYPQVSMLLDPKPGELERPYMLVIEDYIPSDSDVLAFVYLGTQFVDRWWVGLGNEGGTFANSRHLPRVECDGQQFLVGYVERATPSSPDANVWLSNYLVIDTYGPIVACTNQQALATSGVEERDVALYSAAGSGGPSGRYFGTYFFESSNGTYDVQGALFDGCTSGQVTSFCSNSFSCPCALNGAPGHGCGNSAHQGGALLEWLGNASVAADTSVLRASDMPATATCLFFQGTFSTSGTTLGNGRRCVFGPTIRLGVESSTGGVASYPQLGDLSISVRGLVPMGGQQLFYQAWYRDPGATCVSNEPYNLTNALRVDWIP